jgi:hypothetical protein
MEPRDEEKRDKETGAKGEEPPPANTKRFRVVKLEERIAPSVGAPGNFSTNGACSCLYGICRP